MKPEFSSDDFQNALRDYYYLINNYYPERGSLKLVGDRYRLTGDQRTILYRGVSSYEKSALRQKKLVKELNNSVLFIDGYNVLFTLLNYRLGKVLFLSCDGILRDAGSLHGRLRDDKLLNECITLLFSFLAGHNSIFLHIYLDSPVSHSKDHCALINSTIEKFNLKGICEIVKSADHFLRESKGGIIATSDTAIIDHTTLNIIDIPFLMLGEKPGILNLSAQIISSSADK